MAHDILLPKSPEEIIKTISEISDFANNEKYSMEEKLMVLVPLKEDYNTIPNHIHEMISVFIGNVIENLETRIPQW